MREGLYQSRLINKIRCQYPGCVVLKNDTSFMQGIPELSIYNEDRWAMLEVKPAANARVQPNQNFYVDMLNEMSYAAFIYPQNEEQVLDDLQSAFYIRR